ncbi:hypothetical protein ScPMuIL_005711 [Solemya velum]
MAASMSDTECNYRIVKNTKGKAAVWNHFGFIVRDGETAVEENVTGCNICKVIVKCSGGTTNLTVHLRRHHPNVFVSSTSAVSKSKTAIGKGCQTALTTDGWSSRATESYIKVTSSHIDENWNMTNYVLQTRAVPESHTGEHVAAVLQAAVDEWNIPTQQTAPFNPPLVSDNASNMVKAAQSFNSKFHLRCYAHTLNLAAQKCLKVKRASHILARMRKIVAFFHRSNIAADMLKRKAEGLFLPQHKLIIDVCTRWNSAYDMVNRFLEMQVAVSAVLRSKEVGKVRDSDMKSFSDEDLTVSEEIKPLKDITTPLCSEQTPTASIIMPLHHRLTTSVFSTNDNDSAVIKEMKNILVSDLQDR